MIKIERTPCPLILKTNSRKWLKDLHKEIEDYSQLLKSGVCTSKQLATKSGKVEKARGKYRHNSVKCELRSMFNGKCAYCEAKIIHIAWGDIEHFYPKAKFVDKTFAWENLLLSCSRCNVAKAERFPMYPDNTPKLIDPTDESTDPINHLKFEWDPMAGLALIMGTDQRGSLTESTFDLNRKDLLAHRSQFVKKLAVILILALKGREEAVNCLNDATQADQEYAAFSRTLHNAFLKHIGS